MSPELLARPAPSHQSHALLDPISSSFIQLAILRASPAMYVHADFTVLTRTSIIRTTPRYSVRGGQAGTGKNTTSKARPQHAVNILHLLFAPCSVFSLLLRGECSLPLLEIDLNRQVDAPRHILCMYCTCPNTIQYRERFVMLRAWSS